MEEKHVTPRGRQCSSAKQRSPDSAPGFQTWRLTGFPPVTTSSARLVTTCVECRLASGRPCLYERSPVTTPYTSGARFDRPTLGSYETSSGSTRYTSRPSKGSTVRLSLRNLHDKRTKVNSNVVSALTNDSCHIGPKHLR